MKKLAAFLSVVLIVFGFSACTPTRVELKNRIVIEAIGIDKGENEGIRLSFQYLNTDQSTNPINGGTPEETVKVSTIEDISIASALNQLTEIIGKVPMLSQNRVVVFGRALAQDGIEKYIDYFNRNAADRATVLLAVAEDTAQEIIEAKMGEGVIPAKEIENVLRSVDYNAATFTQALYSFINDLKNRTNTPTLPLLGLKETQEEHTEPEIRATAVFERDKMVAELAKAHTAGLLWLTDRFETGTYNVTVSENKNVVLSILKSKTRISVSQSNQKPHYTVRVRCVADCVEVNNPDSNALGNTDIQKIQTAAQQQIEQQISSTAAVCFTQLQADPFGFGNRLWRVEPKLYRTLSQDWKAILPEIGCTVQATVEIRKIGEGYIKQDVDTKL